MFGAGYIEMLARQMTADLQAIRDAIRARRDEGAGARACRFGTLTRRADGSGTRRKVEGLAALSLVSPALDRSADA